MMIYLQKKETIENSLNALDPLASKTLRLKMSCPHRYCIFRCLLLLEALHFTLAIREGLSGNSLLAGSLR